MGPRPGGVGRRHVCPGRGRRRFGGQVDDVNEVLVTAEGRRACSAGSDRTGRLWDLATGKEVRRYVGHASGCRIALSPDGRRLLTAGGGDEYRGVVGFDNV